MGVISADRYPQYNGIHAQTVTSGTGWTTVTSSDFGDVLMTGAVPAGSTSPGLRFTTITVNNTGSVAIEVIWSRDAAVISGKGTQETVIVPAGESLTLDLYPYSTVDPTDPSIVYGPRALGFPSRQGIDFHKYGRGYGCEPCQRSH